MDLFIYFVFRYAKNRVSCLHLVGENQIWAGSYDSVIYVINTDTRKSEQQLQNHSDFVSDIMSCKGIYFKPYSYFIPSFPRSQLVFSCLKLTRETAELVINTPFCNQRFKKGCKIRSKLYLKMLIFIIRK